MSDVNISGVQTPVPYRVDGAGAVDGDRFFGIDIAIPVMNAVIGKVAKHVIPAAKHVIRKQFRELDDAGQEEVAERDLAQVLEVTLTGAMTLVPTILEHLQSHHRELPDGARDPEAYDRFLDGLLAKVAPFAIGIGKNLAGKLLNRDLPAEGDPEAAERGVGAALLVLIPAITEAMPEILAAVKGDG